MSASRKQYYFKEHANPTTSYDGTGQAVDLQFTSRHVKMVVEGASGVIEYSLIGPNSDKIDGVLKAADGVVDFPGMETQKIAIRKKSGTVDSVRIWAWK